MCIRKVSILLFAFFLGLSAANSQVFVGRPDPCKVYGRIYFEPNKHLADVRVYLEDDSEAFAQLLVFKANNKFYSDKPGLWYITTDKKEADFWVYIEPNRGQADFSIAYIQTESFAGCK